MIRRVKNDAKLLGFIRDSSCKYDIDLYLGYFDNKKDKEKYSALIKQKSALRRIFECIR